MSSQRKFYRNVIHLEILSETPIENCESLASLSREIESGDYSGKLQTVIDNDPIDGKQMAQLLKKQGSDTEFFNLDSKGNDM